MTISIEETLQKSSFPSIQNIINAWKVAPLRSSDRKALRERWRSSCEYELKNVRTAEEAHELYKLCPKNLPVRRKAFRKFLRLLVSLDDFDYYSLCTSRERFQPRPWEREIRQRYEEVCITELTWAQTAEEVQYVLFGLDCLGNPTELQQAALENLEILCQAELEAVTSIQELKDLAGPARRLPSGNIVKDQIRSRWEEMCLAELEQCNTPRAISRLLHDSPWYCSSEPNPISAKLESVCKRAIDSADGSGNEFWYLYYPRHLRTKAKLSVVARSNYVSDVRQILQCAIPGSRLATEAARKLAELTA